MDDQTIISIISSGVAGVLALLIGGWLKALQSKASRLLDERVQLLVGTQEKLEIVLQKKADVANITELTDNYHALDECLRKFDRDMVRLEELTKPVESLKEKLSSIESLRSEFLEKFTRRSDFIREMQTLTSQIETIYKKLDRIDERIDERLGAGRK